MAETPTARCDDTMSSAASSAAESSGTSLSLLERARARDEDAWQRLVALYSPLVASWCRRSGLGETDVGDILQDVFAAVAGHLESFRRGGSGSFRGWLWVIARNKLRDHFRRHADAPRGAGGSSARVRLEQVADDREDAAEGDAEPADEAEVSAVFSRALALVRGEFEAKTWQAFWQVSVEGQPTADVAAQLQMTPGAVRQAKYKVLRRFRQELGDVVQWPRTD